MTEATAALFDEFATAYRRGEAPDVSAYLERAGDEADELAELIDRFLQAVPARKPTEEEIVLMQSRLEHQPPMLLMRLRRKLTRDTVVEALVSRLGLDPAKRAKVGRYYHELEIGALDPASVDARVWDALGEVLSARAHRLVSFRPPPSEVALAYHRQQDGPALGSQARMERAAMPAPDVPDVTDEVDRLFTGSH